MDGGDRSGGGGGLGGRETGSWVVGGVRACVLNRAGVDFDWEMRLMGEREKSSQAQLTPDA